MKEAMSNRNPLATPEERASCPKAARGALHSVALAAAGVMVLHPSIAAAYVGPGVGLSVIGTVLALVAAVGLAIVGFVWYPMKRMLARKRTANVAAETSADEAAVPGGQRSSGSAD